MADRQKKNHPKNIKYIFQFGIEEHLCQSKRMSEALKGRGDEEERVLKEEELVEVEKWMSDRRAVRGPWERRDKDWVRRKSTIKKLIEESDWEKCERAFKKTDGLCKRKSVKEMTGAEWGGGKT